MTPALRNPWARALLALAAGGIIATPLLMWISFASNMQRYRDYSTGVMSSNYEFLQLLDSVLIPVVLVLGLGSLVALLVLGAIRREGVSRR